MCSCRTRASYVVPRLLNALAEARAILSAPIPHFSYLHASIVQHTMAAPKRKGFDPKAGSTATPRPAATKIPKVEAIQIGPAWHAPPAEVARKMGDGGQWLIGIDIETAGWKESVFNTGSIGQFGFYNLCAQSDFESRVCQLGWAFGAPGQPEVKKEHLVKPDGWVISDKAFKTHKITLAQADAHGRPLAEILAEFCTDAKAVADRGGRLVCHHMARGGETEVRRNRWRGAQAQA